MREEEHNDDDDEAEEQADKEEARWEKCDGEDKKPLDEAGTGGVCGCGGSVRRGTLLGSVWCVRLRSRDVKKGVTGEKGVECGGVRPATGNSFSIPLRVSPFFDSSPSPGTIPHTAVSSFCGDSGTPSFFFRCRWE